MQTYIIINNRIKFTVYILSETEQFLPKEKLWRFSQIIYSMKFNIERLNLLQVLHNMICFYDFAIYDIDAAIEDYYEGFEVF